MNRLAAIKPTWTDGTRAFYKINPEVTVEYHGDTDLVTISGTYKGLVSALDWIKAARFRWDSRNRVWSKVMKRPTDRDKLVSGLAEILRDGQMEEIEVDVPKLNFRLSDRDINDLKERLGAHGKPRWVKAGDGWKLSLLIKAPVNAIEYNEVGEEIRDWQEDLISRNPAPKARPSGRGYSSGLATPKQIETMMRIPAQDWFDINMDVVYAQTEASLRRMDREIADFTIAEYMRRRRRRR